MIAVVVGTAPGFEEEFFGLAHTLSSPYIVVGVGNACAKIQTDINYSWHGDIWYAKEEAAVSGVVSLNNFVPKVHGGSSALHAILFAIDELSIKKVIVVGVRLEGCYEKFRGAWIPFIGGSLSLFVRGYAKNFASECFGEYTPGWVEE
jgi:hypothetical protein